MSASNSVHYLYNVAAPHAGPQACLTGHATDSFYIKTAFSPTGDHVLSGSSDGHACIWPVCSPDVQASCATCDNSALATIWRGGCLQQWQCASGLGSECVNSVSSEVVWGCNMSMCLTWVLQSHGLIASQMIASQAEFDAHETHAGVWGQRQQPHPAGGL